MTGCHEMFDHPFMNRMDAIVAQRSVTDATEVRPQQKAATPPNAKGQRQMQGSQGGYELLLLLLLLCRKSRGQMS